jgi:hypothetical protein
MSRFLCETWELERQSLVFISHRHSGARSPTFPNATRSPPILRRKRSSLTSSNTLGSLKCASAWTMARARFSATTGSAKVVESFMKMPLPTKTASAPRNCSSFPKSAGSRKFPAFGWRSAFGAAIQLREFERLQPLRCIPWPLPAAATRDIAATLLPLPHFRSGTFFNRTEWPGCSSTFCFIIANKKNTYCMNL